MDFPLSFALKALLEELKRMKDGGVETLNVEDSTMAGLRDCVGSASVAEPSPSTEAIEPATVDIPLKDTAIPPASPISGLQKSQSSIAARGDLAPPVFELPESGSKQERWEWLRDKVLNCETCLANKNPNRHIVFGVGNLDADIFFCGEAPGDQEEQQGEPFVGPAGQKLNGMISGMGLSREDVYIGNIMNWRPRTEHSYGNRQPSPQEMDFCFPYLKAQVSIVRPKIVVALGNTAIQAMLGYDRSKAVGKIHGNWHEFEGIPMMPTFHPASILHNESKRAKRRVWEDLLKVMERLEMPISEKQRGFFL